MKAAAVIILTCLAGLLPGEELKPIIDNERVVVWSTGMPPKAVQSEYDQVVVFIAKNQGIAFYRPKGKGALGGLGFKPERAITIGLKDHPVAPLPNTTKYPNAFPRPGVKKVLENERVIVWDYTWQPGTPTPMHFHDKDVVVVYLDDGPLQSTTPDGQSVINEYTYGLVKFNLRNRTHTELLTKGSQHAIMTELK